MNKKIALGVGIVIAIIIIILLAIPKDASSPTLDNSQGSSPPAASGDSKDNTEQTSLKTLLASGNSRTCTYNPGGDTASTGTIYMANGKMRGDFSFTASTQNYITHMIVDGTTSYVWLDGQTTGFKTDFTKMDQNSTKGTVNNSGQTNVDPNQTFDFACNNWNADQDKFALPTGVEFNDLAALTPQTTPPGSPTRAQLEAGCNKLPEPNKSQCKAALPKN